MEKISFLAFHFIIVSSSLCAASFTVSSNADSGVNTLRQAIIDLNSSVDLSNTITIVAGLPEIQLASDLPVIQKEVTITTPGNIPQIIDGNTNQFRLFAATAPLTVQNCTLQNGGAIGGNGYNADTDAGGGGGGLGAGGAIYIDRNQSVVLQEVVLANNKAQGGSGGSLIISGGLPKNGGGGGGSSFSSAAKNANTTGNGGGDNPGTGVTGGAGTNSGAGYGGGSGGSGGGAGGIGGGNNAGAAAVATNGGNGGYCAGGGGGGDSTGGSNAGGGGGNGGGNGSAAGINSAGGGGGFGSGGAGATMSSSGGGASAAGGGGGFGGGGGGGGGSSGSGSAGNACGGGGGFGAGGGGGLANTEGSNPGQGGSFGGTGGGGHIGPSGVGGGGAGIGGAIFVGDTASLTLQDNIFFLGNTVQGGAAGTGGTIPGSNGQGYAQDVFLFKGAQLIFNGTDNSSMVFNIQSDQSASVGNLDAGILKQNSGEVALNGSNNYRGNTQINGGILSIASDVLGNPSSSVIFNGGTLEATSSFSSSRTISLTGPGTISVDPSFTLTLSGPISGSGAFTKANTGTLILTGAKTYSGGTTVNAGILQGDTTSLQGNIVDNARVVFNQTGSGTYGGNISGSGNVIKQNSGVVSLTGSNTYTGGTVVNAGTLAVSGSGTLAPAGAITVNAGEFDISGLLAPFLTIGDLNGSGGIVNLGPNALIEGTSNNTSYAGVITGTGSFTKQGAGTLILTGANTYTGGTTVSAGVLQGNATSLQGNILDNASLVFDQASTGTYTGVISGSGTVTKQNTGTLTLTGINTYTGGTTINAGTVAFSGSGTLASTGAITINAGNFDISAITASSQTIGNLSGTGGTVVLGAKTLVEGTSNSTSYAGIITGTGAFTKQGSGTLILTGANNYTGGTTVSSGILQGNTTSLQGNILDNATVVFDQTTTGTYNSVFSGSGNLSKQGAGILSFLNDSSGFAGTSTINAGTFFINGSLGGTCTVSSSGILGGTGTIGNLINNGIVAPGGSIGTLTVNGNYVQGPSGTLEIEIAPSGATDLLQVTGTATLNGILHVIPEPGVYLEGTTYTFLTAATTTGQFSSSFSNLPLNYTINYFPTQVQLFLTTSSLLLPIPNSSLNGNARAIADYLFCASFDFADADLDALADALLSLPINEYSQALNTLTPSPFGALPLMELENNFNIANAFFVSGIGQRSYCYIDMNEPTSIWINPLGFVYSQEGRQEAPGFTAHTYGVVGGVDHLFSDHWSIGLGVGYSHEQLHWKHQVGKARANSAYLGPYLKFDSEYFYLDFLVLGAGNFYDVDRKIVFPGFSREADSDLTTWNLSEILLAGIRLELFNVDNFFFQPEIMLDQLNVFQQDFHEKGAGSIDLSVERKYSSFLRSLVNAKFVKEWAISNVCVVPSVNVGWLRTTPLTGSHYTASFREGTFCAPDFTVKSFHKAIDQLLIGAQLLISCQGDFQFSIGYEGNFGKGTRVNEMNLGMRWRF
ncbi:MAG: hypothetical protein C5B45_03910 [Chlamydiae bacterium]|nr:MAG: hypothetical protein C5B45_03910 [Chlamydiota bacterium]